MAFLRLMLMIPLVRMFLLLDIGLFEDGSEPTREEMMRDEIVPLWARAVAHMHKLGWPDTYSSEHTLMVAKRPYKRHWFSWTRYEPVYMTMRGTSIFAGLYLMRNGMIYTSDVMHYEYEEYKSEPTHQLVTDLMTINPNMLANLYNGFVFILEIQPEPVYIDN